MGLSTFMQQTVSQAATYCRASSDGMPGPHQNTARVRSLRCAHSSGMDPYRPKGVSTAYSNTSRLYRR